MKEERTKQGNHALEHCSTAFRKTDRQKERRKQGKHHEWKRTKEIQKDLCEKHVMEKTKNRANLMVGEKKDRGNPK